MPGSCSLKLEFARQRMGALGHTQASLAADCGVDVRTVQRWFAGQRVSLARAEEVARALGVGTSDLFDDAPEDGLKAFVRRMAQLQRLLQARDGAFASGFRIVQEQFGTALKAVSHTAHPAHGFVARLPTTGMRRRGFACVRLECHADEAEVALRFQLGKRFGYVVGGVRVERESAQLVEIFQVRSMQATRAADGSLGLWFWVSDALQEIIVVSDAEVQLQGGDGDGRQSLDLDEDLPSDALCIRPTNADLRAAGLPMGFDCLTGARAGRVDVPVDWDPADLRPG